MKRPPHKKLTKIVTGLVGFSTIPVTISSCGVNQTKYSYTNQDQHQPILANTVVSVMTEQFAMFSKQLNEFVQSSQLFDDKAKQLVNDFKDLIDHDLISLLLKISKDSKIQYLDNKDPIDIFQDVLCMFKLPIINAINNICNSSIVYQYIDKQSLEDFKSTMWGILNHQIELKSYIKTHWSLQDLYIKILYPNYGREKSWEIINQVFSDVYYTGINYDHKDGTEIIEDYELINTPIYSNKYDWSSVHRGDIVFSSVGFSLCGHYSGHCAIVDGWKTAKVASSGQEVRYLRVIEANQYGVSYGLVDDNRMENDKIAILHINTTQKKIENAVEFCEDQLGKNYSIPIFLTEDTASDTAAWYCSELVWAGYKRQNIDIKENKYYRISLPGVLPWEIYYSNYASKVIGLDF